MEEELEAMLLAEEEAARGGGGGGAAAAAAAAAAAGIEARGAGAGAARAQEKEEQGVREEGLQFPAPPAADPQLWGAPVGREAAQETVGREGAQGRGEGAQGTEAGRAAARPRLSQRRLAAQ
eukprot:2887131-Rhodomonas_salina.1